MKFQKFFGWLLLLTGILIIFLTLYSSYNIFVVKTEAPEIFKITEENEELNSSKNLSFKFGEDIMKEVVEEQIKEMFPTAFLSMLFNLIAWSIFAGISIFAGVQISNLGIKLTKC